MDETYRSFVATWGRLTWTQRMILYSRVVLHYGNPLERINAFFWNLFTPR